MTGKVCIVTGANSGIGKATALGLAQQGAHVVMVCRNAAKGQAAKAEIESQTGNTHIDLLLANLASQQAIRQLADKILANYERIDVLVNNAGVYLGSRSVTDEGYESTFAINHLAYFLLTHLLLDRLKANAPSRIVNVSSEAHQSGKMHFDDLDLTSGYNGIKAYAQSKLCNVLFTYHLAKHLEGTGVTANVLHPGVVGTNIGQGSVIGWMFRVFASFMLSPTQGANTSLYLATSPGVEDVSGKYFIKRKAQPSSRPSYDEKTAERLWAISLERTGLN